MDQVFKKIGDSLTHLQVLDQTFTNSDNFDDEEKLDRVLYQENKTKLRESFNKLGFDKQFYAKEDRQMILADFLEYVFFGRGYRAVKTKSQKSDFIKAILSFVNLLMCYEVLTVSNRLRHAFLETLKNRIPSVERESHFNTLLEFEGRVGLKKGETEASEDLDDYFDTLLPKTAGGLWHELLVYAFLLRMNSGHIVPLLLSQRLLGLSDHLVPPDFLIIGKDKRIYGVEVGTKKEIQSGSFSLRTAIPTATVDTENSRTSDRCPLCKRWIPFCPVVIEKYSNLDEHIAKSEIKCLEQCNKYTSEQIASGTCPYTKYRRNRAETLEHTHHDYSDGLHYHYRCVLNSVPTDTKDKIIAAEDRIALKTHLPYYGGLEGLISAQVLEENTTEQTEQPT